ncbi:MAG: hypothetical protein ACYC7J_18550 [Syntrophales bacterium]
MARRITKAETLLFLIVVLIGLPLYFIGKFVESIGWGWFVFFVVAITGGYWWHKSTVEKAQRAEMMRKQQLHSEAILKEQGARRTALMGKYGDAKVVEAIMTHSYWQGQTSEQLRDSMGHPYDIDEKVLKTKRKEIWKYNPLGANRFGLRITVENDIVVGWDAKS